MNQRLVRRRRRDGEPDLKADVNILAEKLGFVYVHIPKTGGTSVKDALGIRPVFGHKTALMLRSQISPIVWDKAFKFCFVRNPWDRLVSWFEFSRGNIVNKHRKLYGSFDEWMLDDSPHGWQDDWRLQAQDANPLRQFNFLMDFNKKSLVDFIGRFENFEKDFQYVLSKIGRRASLQKSNIGTRRRGKDYHAYYTPQTKEMVSRMFAEEIDYFEYRY